MVKPRPGRSGMAIMPSFASTVSSTRSWIIGLAPSEYSTMKLAGEAAQTCSPAKKQGAPAHRCGAKRRLKALAIVPIRIASLMPPQKAGSGWKMSAAFSTARSRKAKRVASLSPVAIGTLPDGPHLGHARLVVGDHRLLEPGEIAVGDHAGRSAWRRRPCRCRARRPSGRRRARAPARAARTRAAETCGAPSIAPTRIFTALKPPWSI